MSEFKDGVQPREQREENEKMTLAMKKVRRALEIYEGNQDGTVDGISSMRKVEGKDGGESDMQLCALVSGFIIKNHDNHEDASRVARRLKGEERALDTLFQGIIDKIRRDIKGEDFWGAAVMRDAAAAMRYAVDECRANDFDEFAPLQDLSDRIGSELYALDSEIKNQARAISQNVKLNEAPRILTESASRPGIFSDYSGESWWLAPLEN
jgi:hypothetical protein